MAWSEVSLCEMGNVLRGFSVEFWRWYEGKAIQSVMNFSFFSTLKFGDDEATVD